MSDADFDPSLPVRDVIESLVRTVLGSRDDLFDTLFHQVANSQSNVDYLRERWGDLSEIAQTKIACDVGYKAWVLLDTGLGDDATLLLEFAT